MDYLVLLKDYQGLVGAVIAFVVAVILAPRITERYARSREYWKLRMAHAQAVADFGMVLRTLPPAPVDLYHGEYHEFNDAIGQAVALANQGTVLYDQPLHEALFQLLQHSLILPQQERIRFWGALTQFLRSEIRRPDQHAQIGVLAEILPLGNEMFNRAKLADVDRTPGSPALAPTLAKWNIDVASAFTSKVARWALPRPWRWPAWIGHQRLVSKATKRLKRSGPSLGISA